MNNDEVFSLIIALITQFVGMATFFRFHKKRDERETQAFFKALKFTTISIMFLASLIGIILFNNLIFSIPMAFIFILILLGFLIMLLMYEIYLRFENLEPTFISKLSKERKSKLYNILLIVNLYIMIIPILLNTFVFKIKYASVIIVPCLFIQFFIITKMPKKKLNKEKKLAFAKRKKILIISCLSVSFVFFILGFAFFQLTNK